MICIPVMAETNRKAIDRMKMAFARADMVELRLDRIHRPDLSALMAPRRGNLLVTNRRKEEGGYFGGTEMERVDLLAEAVRLGADYVDIEASTEATLVGRLDAAIEKNRGATKWIVSHHDLQGTPSWPDLVDQYYSCRAFLADAVKIVTYALSVEDNLRLLQLVTLSLSEGQAIIAFCMGPLGRISRLLAPILGSCVTYASLRKGAESAPGQWTLAEMRKIMPLLGFEFSRLNEPWGKGRVLEAKGLRPITSAGFGTGESP